MAVPHGASGPRRLPDFCHISPAGCPVTARSGACAGRFMEPYRTGANAMPDPHIDTDLERNFEPLRVCLAIGALVLGLLLML